MISEFQVLTNQHAQRTALEMESWVKATLFSDFTLVSKFDWSPKRRCSRGGIYKEGPGINIAMCCIPKVNDIYRFYEYPSFDTNSIIGGFYSKRPYDKLEVIIAHEVAHAVQFFSYKKLNTRCTPHGLVFKLYYTLLRKQFINYKLPQQKMLTSEYESYISKLQNSTIATLQTVYS